jgi:hypothetical protein
MAALPNPARAAGLPAPGAAALSQGAIDAFLVEVVPQLAPDLTAPRAGPGRPPLLSSLCLWTGVLVCVLRGLPSQRAVWRLLCQHGLAPFPRLDLTDQAVRARLAREAQTAGPSPLARLFGGVRDLLWDRLPPLPGAVLAPWASAVLAVDQTTLDQVARKLQSLWRLPAGDRALLPGKLTALFDLRRQLWQQIQYVSDPCQNEKKDLTTLLGWLPAGCLLVMDLGYFSFAFFDALIDGGHHFVSRLREKTSYTIEHVYYQQGDTLDCLVFLGKHRADRMQHLVRLVQFRAGKTVYRYVTSQTDPVRFPLHEVAAVYQRRWDVELAFRLVKQYLGLGQLWASKPQLVLQQVWAVLVVSQVVQALRQEVAAAVGEDVFAVSLPLLLECLPQYLAQSVDPVARLVAEGRRFGVIRPARRVANQAPTLPATALSPPPADLVRERTPRYAQRNCGPRTATAPTTV